MQSNHCEMKHGGPCTAEQMAGLGTPDANDHAALPGCGRKVICSGLLNLTRACRHLNLA